MSSKRPPVPKGFIRVTDSEASGTERTIATRAILDYGPIRYGGGSYIVREGASTLRVYESPETLTRLILAAGAE